MAVHCPFCGSVDTQTLLDRFQCLAHGHEFFSDGTFAPSDAYPTLESVPSGPHPEYQAVPSWVPNPGVAAHSLDDVKPPARPEGDPQTVPTDAVGPSDPGSPYPDVDAAPQAPIGSESDRPSGAEVNERKSKAK